jgi:hypothetical protein
LFCKDVSLHQTKERKERGRKRGRKGIRGEGKTTASSEAFYCLLRTNKAKIGLGAVVSQHL